MTLARKSDVPDRIRPVRGKRILKRRRERLSRFVKQPFFFWLPSEIRRGLKYMAGEQYAAGPRENSWENDQAPGRDRKDDLQRIFAFQSSRPARPEIFVDQQL